MISGLFVFRLYQHLSLPPQAFRSIQHRLPKPALHYGEKIIQQRQHKAVRRDLELLLLCYSMNDPVIAGIRA